MTTTRTPTPKSRVPRSILSKMALGVGGLGLLLAAGCSEPAGAAVTPTNGPTVQPVEPAASPAAPLPLVHMTTGEPVVGCKLPYAQPEPEPEPAPSAQPEATLTPEPVPDEPEEDHCPWCGRG